MPASPPTLERPEFSPPLSHGFPKRVPSPLNASHIAQMSTSPETDSLIQDDYFQQSPPRLQRKGLTWDLGWKGWKTHRKSDSSATLLPSSTEIEKAEGQTKRMKVPWHHGWRTALFGTYFNAFLLLIPVSIALHFTVKSAESVVFVFCVLFLIPLIRLHYIATASLARRIGGSKAGLLNASLSNLVEMVIAFIALRKCELRIVQSTLIGSMMCKSLLVFGMCTFAGGLRWKEQWFNPAAIQLQSSLLSMSVGAILMPAVYHFALRIDQGTESEATNLVPAVDIDTQKAVILKMSHGVSVLLLLVYVAYLTFQLYSHSHLYEDDAAGTHSREYKKKSKGKRVHTRETTLSSGELDALEPPLRRSESPLSFPHSLVLDPEVSIDYSMQEVPLQNNVKAIRPTSRGSLTRAIPMYRTGTPAINRSDATLLDYEEHPSPLGQDTVPGSVENKEADLPELSWFMTVLILVVVSVMVGITARWVVITVNESAVSKYVSKGWTGLILLPLIRAIADCVAAVNVSVKDRLTISGAVAIGSTIQLSLFVIPFIVIVAWIMGYPLGLLFDPFESVALYIAIHTMNYVVADGRTNWMEGLVLICFYLIIATSFWFYPGTNLASGLDVCIPPGSAN